MHAFELLEATIPHIQTALATGGITSRRLVELYLARIAAYDQRGPHLNAISVVNDNAVAEADELDRERVASGARGPLHGIPVLLKDNYETRDMQTAAGSILLKGWIPPADAFIVRRLRQAGAIILGKTNMTEFAYGITNAGSLFGETRNPYALEHNPGGSSGGTGAAVAANFATLGWGSDTCGSIRVPAAHNNLFGLRGTQGLSSRTGIIPLSHTQDIGGPLARTVTDLALGLDATVGYDPADAQTAASVGRIPASYTSQLNPAALRGARIGALTELIQLDAGDGEVALIFRRALDAMAAQCAEIVDVSIPHLAELLSDRLGGYLVLRQEFKFDIDAYLASRPSAPIRSLDEIIASKKYHPATESRLLSSQRTETLDSVEYRAALLKRREVQLTVFRAMIENGVDVLAYPPIRRKALLLGKEQPGNNCMLSSTSGLPAISMPAGFTDDGLPVGLELLGREWDEARLLGYAYAYEQARKPRRAPESVPALPG